MKTAFANAQLGSVDQSEALRQQLLGLVRQADIFSLHTVAKQERVHTCDTDILIFGCGDTHQDAEADHDEAMVALLERARQKNLKLNKNKLKFKEKQVMYMGHILTDKGIKPDPQKIIAIQDMCRPEDAAVLRLLAMLNFLGQYLQNLSHITESLRRLTYKDA